ncbi:MAG: hypothetical protein ABI397_00090 [Candidatus Saccharimonas sp.]
MSVSDIKKRLHHYWRVYGTLNNIVMSVAVVIGISWAWGSISTIQRNFAAQKSLVEQQRQLELTQLEVDLLKYQQNYYKTSEYQDLAARRDLGLASPGEDVLMLPPNSQAVINEDAADADSANPTDAHPTPVKQTEGNFNQWLDFLSGNAAKASLRQ